MRRSSLELSFDQYLALLGKDLPQHEMEFGFAKPERAWRLDFAWPERKVAVELEGGTWVGGRHNRGSGFEEDAVKYNAAVLRGWCILRYTTTMLKNDPAGCIDQVRRLIHSTDIMKIPA